MKKRAACKKDKSTLTFSLAALVVLFTSCGGRNPNLDDGEIPPTPITGSGVRIFQFDSGTIVCDISTVDPRTVDCQAMASTSGVVGVIRQLLVGFDPAVDFASDIVFTEWQPLQMSWSGGSAQVNNPVLSQNNTHANYAMPGSVPLVAEMQIDGELLVRRNDGSERRVQSQGTVVVGATPTPTVAASPTVTFTPTAMPTATPTP